MAKNETPRKDCPACGLPDAPFYRSSKTKDGMGHRCKMCCAEYASRVDWKEVNRQRRSTPEGLAKWRKQANDRAKERRKVDPEYRRSQAEVAKKWRERNPDARERENEKRREKRRVAREQVTEQQREQSRLARKQSIDNLFKRRKP
jgi:hypothetical protein